MRIDRRGLQQFPGGIDDRDFAAGAETGVEAEHGFRAGGRRQQQLMQIAAENFDRLGFRRFTQLQQQFGAEMQMHLHPPGPVANVGQPFVGAAAAVFDAEMRRDHARRRDAASTASRLSPKPRSIFSTPSVRPRNSARARCDGIVRMVSE